MKGMIFFNIKVVKGGNGLLWMDAVGAIFKLSFLAILVCAIFAT